MDRAVQDDGRIIVEVGKSRLNGKEHRGEIGPHDRFEGLNGGLPERRRARNAGIGKSHRYRNLRSYILSLYKDLLRMN